MGDSHRRKTAAAALPAIAGRLLTMPFIEAIVSAILGFIISLIDKKISTGLLLFAFGIIFGSSRFAFTRTLRLRLRPLSRLSRVVDINRRIALPQFLELVNIYMQIHQEDFRLLKDAIIEGAALDLQQLAHQKRSRELATSEYYQWLYVILENQRGGEIWAVSTMNPLEWDESPTERKFIQHNKDAVERGVNLARVFVVDRNQESGLYRNPGTNWHFERRKRIDPYIVIREDLEKKESKLLREVGDGFIAFDRRVAMVDVFSPCALGGPHLPILISPATRCRHEYFLTSPVAARYAAPAQNRVVLASGRRRLRLKRRCRRSVLPRTRHR